MRSAKEVLSRVPFLKSYRGYEDMILCMELVAEDEERLVRIRERVYLPVAELRGESVHTLEKNLRTFRQAFLMNGGREYLEACLKRKIDTRIFPRELIEALAECMKIS